MNTNRWILILLVALWFFPLSHPARAAHLVSFPREGDRPIIPDFEATVHVVEGRADLQIRRLEEPMKPMADPLEPINRIFFQINDKLYFWLLKPVASVYGTIIPQPARVSVRNFFDNIAAPIRGANCLLQLDLRGFGNETARFVVNSTIGLAGLFDPAKKRFNIQKQEEDFGQTLGFWDIGPVFYIDWPVLGPSSLRDTAGTVGDFFLTPLTYLVEFPILVDVAIGTCERVNNTSLTLGEYEDLKKAALDPYIALRDAYHQFRQQKIKER